MAASVSSTHNGARSPKKGSAFGGWRARLRAGLQLRWLRFLLVVSLASLFAIWARDNEARWLQFIDNLVLDQGFQFRPRVETPERIAESDDEIFRPDDLIVLTLPHSVPRPLLGQLLRKTKAAKAVAIDMMLSDRVKELSPIERTFPIYQKAIREWEAEDAQFAKDIKDVGNVVLGQWPEEVLDGEGPNARKHRVWQKPPKIIWDSAKYHASFWVEPDLQDGKIRTLRPFQNIPDGKKSEHIPALGVAVAAAKLGISPEKLAKTPVKNDEMRFGDRRIPLKDGLLTINYYSDRRYFEGNGENHSSYDVAVDNFFDNDEAFGGKLVFIGETSFKSKDIFTTPFGDMPGVHIHAHTVMTLLDKRGAPRPVSTWWAAIIGILASLLLVFPILRWPTWIVFLLGIIEIVAVVIGAAFLFSLHNWLIPASIPVTIIALSVASFTALEHAFIRSALGRFVGRDSLPRVAGTLGRLEPGGDEEDTAAFICDIRGFSTLSQNLPAREAGRLASEYAGVVSRAVWPFGGHIADFAGDGALVIFTRSQSGDDYIWNATKAALSLREHMAEWQNDWDERDWGELRFGVGLHAGRPWVGLIGVEELMKVGAAGDDINVAARVQGLSKHTEHDILITEPVYQSIRQKVKVVPLGPKELTGRKGTILVYGLQDALLLDTQHHSIRRYRVKTIIEATKKRLKIS